MSLRNKEVRGLPPNHPVGHRERHEQNPRLLNVGQTTLQWLWVHFDIHVAAFLNGGLSPEIQVRRVKLMLSRNAARRRFGFRKLFSNSKHRGVITYLCEAEQAADCPEQGPPHASRGTANPTLSELCSGSARQDQATLTETREDPQPRQMRLRRAQQLPSQECNVNFHTNTALFILGRCEMWLN